MFCRRVEGKIVERLGRRLFGDVFQMKIHAAETSFGRLNVGQHQVPGYS